MKKLFCFALSLILVIPMSLSAFATEFDGDKVISDCVVTDSDEIQRIQLDDPVEIPEGYHIEEIRYVTVAFDSAEAATLPPYLQPQLFDKWEVKNVSKDSNEYYFPNNPLTSDWIDGPSSYTETFKYTVTGTYTSDVSVKAEVVEAGVGFSVSEGTEFEKSYNISVPQGKKMNLKVYGNYFRYSFDVYKNNEYQGSGKAYKPIGLTFKQVLYAQ